MNGTPRYDFEVHATLVLAEFPKSEEADDYRAVVARLNDSWRVPARALVPWHPWSQLLGSR
jgi:hypothetical protein